MAAAAIATVHCECASSLSGKSSLMRCDGEITFGGRERADFTSATSSVVVHYVSFVLIVFVPSANLGT